MQTGLIDNIGRTLHVNLFRTQRTSIRISIRAGATEGLASTSVHDSQNIIQSNTLNLTNSRLRHTSRTDKVANNRRLLEINHHAADATRFFQNNRFSIRSVITKRHAAVATANKDYSYNMRDLRSIDLIPNLSSSHWLFTHWMDSE